jgi:hypothetical protein
MMKPERNPRAATHPRNRDRVHRAHAAGLARRPGPRGASAAAVLALALLLPGAALAAMYKWVDDKGVVHYSDQVPPAAVNKGNVELSPQGIPIRKVAPAMTPEQRSAHEAELARQGVAAKGPTREQIESARHDRALLQSYTTAADIDLAKARALQTLQAALQSAQGYSTQLTKRRAALVERKASYAGKPVPADIDRDIAAVDAQLARQGELIARKQKELVDVATKYDADKARWQELAAGGGDTASPQAPLPVSRK